LRQNKKGFKQPVKRQGAMDFVYVLKGTGLFFVGISAMAYVGLCLYDKWWHIQQRITEERRRLHVIDQVLTVVNNVVNNGVVPYLRSPPPPPPPTVNSTNHMVELLSTMINAQSELIETGVVDDESVESEVLLADVLAATTVELYTPTEASNDYDCAICKEPLRPTDVMRTINGCKHSFHISCLDTALVRSATCPLCRYSIEEEEEEDGSDDDSTL
jgi:hypothetical protein